MKITSGWFAVAFAAGALAAPCGAGTDDLARDRQELEAFEEILGVLHATAAKRNLKEYMKLNINLHAAMVREVEQAAFKASAERREGRTAGGPGERHRLWTAEGRHETLTELVREAEDLIPFLQKWDRRAVARNRDILDEFFEIMVTDLRASGGTWRTGRT